MPRDTVLLGDARTGSARALRRQIYFTEPGSGRRTHRKITGHVGGSSGMIDQGCMVQPIRNTPLPSVSARLDKISSIRRGAELGVPVYRPTPTPKQRVGRGSNSHVVAHLDFETSLRSNTNRSRATAREPGELLHPVTDAHWRRVAAFDARAATANAAVRYRPYYTERPYESPRFDSVSVPTSLPSDPPKPNASHNMKLW